MFGFQHQKKEVVGVLDSFVSFFKKYEENKSHDMFSLMLDARFKTLPLVSSLFGREQGKTISEEYDQKPFFPMFLTCHYHLHPLAESKRGIVDRKVKEDSSLDIFEMTANTSEPTMELINKELLIFKRYQVNVEDIKCPPQWWEK